MHQCTQCASGAHPQALLQPFARQKKKHKHCQRIEINLASPPSLRFKRSRGTDSESNDDANSYWQIHADTALHQVAPGIAEKRFARKQQHRKAEHPGSPTKQLFNVWCNVARLREVSRGGIHHDLHHAKASNEPAPQSQTRLLPIMAKRQGILGRQHFVA